MRDELSNRLITYNGEHVVVKVGDDDQCKEIHHRVHHRGVRKENHQVDKFDTNNHRELGQADHVGGKPALELPRVIEGVAHNLEGLLNLCNEGDVQEAAAQEATDHQVPA